MTNSVPFHIYAVISNLIFGSLGIAVSILLILQPQNDSKSRGYLYLSLVGVIVSLSTSVLNLALMLQLDIRPTFNILTIGYLGVLFFFFNFTIEAFDRWQYTNHIVKGFLFVILCIGIIMVISNTYTTRLGADAEGYLSYAVQPLAFVITVVPGWLIPAYCTWVVVNNVKRKTISYDSRVLWGFFLIIGGNLSLVITPIYRSIGGLMETLGVIFLAGPILKERLFDPLAQLNVKLAYRSEQLQAITKVGQYANSLLVLDVILESISTEIKKIFPYSDLTLYIVDKSSFQLKPATEVPNEAITPAIVRQAFQLHQATKTIESDQDELRSPRVSEIAVPLIFGLFSESRKEIVGILHIWSDHSNAFDQETLEVVEILSNQLAIAIRNARLFEELQQANAAKTDFISYLSHEIRNPINNILHTSNFVLNYPQMFDNVSLPEVYQSDIFDIEHNARLLGKLVDNVLDLAKIEAGKMEIVIKEIDPLPILEEVRKNALIQLHAGVEFSTSYMTPLPLILADDLRLTQLLTNLVGNAVKFTTTGKITLGAYAKDNLLHFFVSDTGPGIPQSVLNNLYIPYLQGPRDVTSEVGGTGLGLHISKRLIELQSGTISVESQPAKGTTFYFTLPITNLKPQ